MKSVADLNAFTEHLAAEHGNEYRLVVVAGARLAIMAKTGVGLARRDGTSTDENPTVELMGNTFCFVMDCIVALAGLEHMKERLDHDVATLSMGVEAITDQMVEANKRAMEAMRNGPGAASEGRP